MWSQQWLNETVWYSPTHEDAIWWHWQVVIVPRVMKEQLAGKAFLQIEAGSNGGPPNINE
jgi:hypothetical protein